MIYFVRCTETDAIKIGFADDPFRRFSKIQSDSPGKLELLAVEEGDRTREAELHRQFASDRKRGEWFRRSAALQAYAAALPVIGIGRAPKMLGGKLGEWLHRNDINTLQFASRIGCCWSSISHFCAGKRTPSYELMRRIYVETGGEVQPNDFYDLPALPAQEAAA